MNDVERSIRLVAHSGSFHADDVLAIAALTLLVGDNYEIIRTRDPAEIDRGDYVVDVGDVYDPKKRRFDHHQEGGAGARGNGIPYSSIGLVWEHYGVELCNGNEEAAHIVDEQLCQPIDAADNGVAIFEPTHETAFPYLFHNIVTAYHPTWRETDRALDEAFQEMVVFARGLLQREIRHAEDKVAGMAQVRAAYQNAEDKRIIVLDDNYPWGEVLAQYPEPLYVVKKGRERAEWKVEAVRDKTHTFENRKPLPESWAGKRDEELARVTGVSDSIFCHNGRFIAVAGSKEGALALARIAVEA